MSKRQLPPSKRWVPQTKEENIGWVAQLATAYGKGKGLAHDAIRLDVHLQWQRAISEDEAHTDIKIRQDASGVMVDMAQIAGLFLMAMRKIGINYHDPRVREYFSGVVEQAVTQCLDNPECVIREKR